MIPPDRYEADGVSNYRRGGANDQLSSRFRILFNEAKLGALLSGWADRARVSYAASWMAWGMFCYVGGIPAWLAAGNPGWGGPLLVFLIWTCNIIGLESSTLRGRFPSIRFARLINGKADFAAQSRRANGIIKGVQKKDGAMGKHPFNTDLVRRAIKELVAKSASRGMGQGSMYLERYAARIIWSLYISLISVPWALTWGGYRGLYPRWETIPVCGDQAIRNRHL